eukprot:105216-Prorocentrum_minimum.AAC.1
MVPETLVAFPHPSPYAPAAPPRRQRAKLDPLTEEGRANHLGQVCVAEEPLLRAQLRPAQYSRDTVTVQSQYSHSTFTVQSQYSHSTASSQSELSHGAVTVTMR